MSNMSYCRFQNTLLDLRDCHQNLAGVQMAEDEQSARARLVQTCVHILEELDLLKHEISKDEIKQALTDIDAVKEGMSEEDDEEYEGLVNPANRKRRNPQ